MKKPQQKCWVFFVLVCTLLFLTVRKIPANNAHFCDKILIEIFV